jgi:hypothetical protein
MALGSGCIHHILLFFFALALRESEFPSIFDFLTILLDKGRPQSVGLVRYSNKITFEAKSLHSIDARVRLLEPAQLFLHTAPAGRIKEQT